MADNVSTVAQIYEAFGRGDVGAILEELSGLGLVTTASAGVVSTTGYNARGDVVSSATSGAGTQTFAYITRLWRG